MPDVTEHSRPGFLASVLQTVTSYWEAIRQSSAQSHHAYVARATPVHTTTTAETAVGTPGGSSTGRFRDHRQEDPALALDYPSSL